MRKILLTESQAKLILEEIDKNDSIQKLIFCDPSDIEFDVSDEIPAGAPVNAHVLKAFVCGKEIDSLYLDLSFDEVNVNGELYYQLFIDVNEELRRLGIAYKVYLSFVFKDYPVCLLFENATEEIMSLWAKLANEPNIIVDDLVDEDGNKIGYKAYCEE